MIVTKLYDGIYKLLANDPIILNYLGIGENSDALTRAKHIQKRSKPQNLADHLPIICFYAPPGEVSEDNHLVYTTPFVFDVITMDDVALAHNISDRIVELFDGQINPFEGIESYETSLITAHESRTDLPDSYCFTTVIELSASLEA